MLGEIDNNFYCALDSYDKKDGKCVYGTAMGDHCAKNSCDGYHCKHPTPEQFIEEYRREVPDDMPVWVLYDYDPQNTRWELLEYWRYKLMDEDKKINKIVVIACTPFGKPDKDWRP